MADYHKYIWDTEKGEIKGDYEAAYANCDDVHPSQHQLDSAKHHLTTDWLLSLGPEARVLDVGCGYGDYVNHLRQRGVEVTGCDVSPSAIAQGKQRFPACRLDVGDLNQGLGYPDLSFDAVLLFGVLWFLLARLEHCLEEMDRIMKPGALLFCSLGLPANQKVGRDVIAAPEDLRRLLEKHFSIVEFIVLHNSRQLGQGVPLDQCDRDLMAVARKAPKAA